MHQKRKKYVLEAGTADGPSFKRSFQNAPGIRKEEANIISSK